MKHRRIALQGAQVGASGVSEVQREHTGAPANFPAHMAAASQSGRKLQVALDQSGAAALLSEIDPETTCSQYVLCEQVAHDLSGHYMRSLGAVAEIERDRVLLHCLAVLHARAWFTPAQDRWVVRRFAQLLAWRAPLFIGGCNEQA